MKSSFKQKFNKWLSTYGYAVIIAAIVILVDCATYWLTRGIAKHFKVFDFTIKGFDDKVPLIRIFFIPYFLAYPYWIIAPIIAGKNRERFCNWFIAVLISFFVVAVIYCFMPTTISRPIDEMLASSSAIDRFIGNFYLFDGGYVPFGCFPSIHCLLSAFCYIAIRNQKNIHIANRIGILVMDILILLATQFTKQHYIVDLISAVALAELTFFICNKFNLGKGLLKFVDKVEGKFKKSSKELPTTEKEENKQKEKYMKKLRFFKCNHCQNVVVKLIDKNVSVFCCGEKMEEITPNTVEAATEKHLPVVSVKRGLVNVKVGEVSHPMLDEHFINFIVVETENGYVIETLAPNEQPQATIYVGDKKVVAVYEYCNLHGLWKVEL